MLDFYLIPSHLPSHPGDPSSLQHAGELNDQVYSRLQQKKLIEERYDYYSDFRWNGEHVRQKLQLIREQEMAQDPGVKKLLQILLLAEKAGYGLVAYGD